MPGAPVLISEERLLGGLGKLSVIEAEQRSPVRLPLVEVGLEVGKESRPKYVRDTSDIR